MPARHADIAIAPRAVTALSDGAVTAARVQCLHGRIRVQVTATPTPPADAAAFGGAIDLIGGDPRGLGSDEALATLFPGRIAGGGTGWLWAWSETGGAASVSHA